MSISILIDKDVLLQRLAEKRVEAERYDARILKNHKAKAGRFAKKARVEIERASTLDDEELCAWVAKLSNTYERRELWDSAPECPLSMVTEFDDAIDRITLDKRTSFNLDHNGLGYLLHLIEWSPENKKKLC